MMPLTRPKVVAEIRRRLPAARLTSSIGISPSSLAVHELISLFGAAAYMGGPEAALSPVPSTAKDVPTPSFQQPAKIVHGRPSPAVHERAADPRTTASAPDFEHAVRCMEATGQR